MTIHPLPIMSPEALERLRIAKKTKKWGHLASWQELYVFQRTTGTTEQIKQIAAIAHRKNKLKENIQLPYMIYKQESVKLYKR